MTDQTTDKDEAPATKPFAATLREIDHGAFLDEAGDKLAELVEAVQATGKKGRLTLTIDVTKSKAERRVEVEPDIKLTKPKQPRPTSIFYADSAHNLLRNDPDQEEIPGVRAVPNGPEQAPRAIEQQAPRAI